MGEDILNTSMLRITIQSDEGPVYLIHAIPQVKRMDELICGEDRYLCILWENNRVPRKISEFTATTTMDAGLLNTTAEILACSDYAINGKSPYSREAEPDKPVDCGIPVEALL